jgi:hypothetical protein
VLRRILDLRRMKFHNGELESLYCSRNIMRMITSRGLKLESHATRVGKRGRDTCIILFGKPEGKG